jgi:hypothetical protein
MAHDADDHTAGERHHVRLAVLGHRDEIRSRPIRDRPDKAPFSSSRWERARAAHLAGAQWHDDEREDAWRRKTLKCAEGEDRGRAREPAKTGASRAATARQRGVQASDRAPTWREGRTGAQQPRKASQTPFHAGGREILVVVRQQIGLMHQALPSRRNQ